MLQRTIVDAFPDVKKSSCTCASLLARTVPEHFHVQSDNLISPLLINISHQHYKVRVAAVITIGKLLRMTGLSRLSDQGRMVAMSYAIIGLRTTLYTL